MKLQFEHIIPQKGSPLFGCTTLWICEMPFIGIITLLARLCMSPLAGVGSMAVLISIFIFVGTLCLTSLKTDNLSNS
jgi:hypothetical protein